MVLRSLEFLIKVVTTCVMAFIAFVSFMVYIAFANVVRYPDDLTLYNVQLVSIIIGITSVYFGFIPYFFDSYIDFTRIFIRLHNVCVLWILYSQLLSARKSASIAAYEGDMYKEHYDIEECFSTDDIEKLRKALTRTEMNMIILPILCAVLTLIFIWKVIKFIMFYYLEIDV